VAADSYGTYRFALRQQIALSAERAYPVGEGARRSVAVEKQRMITVEELATYADVHPTTVYLWFKKGGLPGKRLGDSWRVSPDAITAWAVCAGGEKLHGMEPLFTLEQAAALLACSPDRVRTLLRREELPGVKLGKLWRVTQRSVYAFMGVYPPGPAPGAEPDPVVGVDRLPRPGAAGAAGLDDVGAGAG
jgi:excisionase family DNA binding protein